MDDEGNWQRQVLIGLVVLVAVGALVGGIVALISIKAADLAGIGSGTGSTQVDRPRTHSGPGDGTPSTTAPTDGSTTSGAPSTGPTSPTNTATSKPPKAGITLTVNPAQVSTYQRINLDGSYPAPDGTVLQVQRKENGQWVDFPTTATVQGGSFHTYIETGHTGTNMLRMLAIGRDEMSNTVKVQVS